MSHGFVALLDVLGFSSLIMAGDVTERLAKYIAGIREILSEVPQVQYVVFSDTIVITTVDDSEEAFQVLLQRSSALFGALLKQGIALRGALACGSFVREDTPGGVFVAGRAVVEAYSFEKKQDWVGIMIAPSTLHRFPDLDHRCDIDPPGSSRSTEEGMRLIMSQSTYSGFLQRCRKIPFHSDVPFASNSFEGLGVIPTSGIPTASALSLSLGESIGSLAFLKSVAPDPAAQNKYRAAIDWLDPIRRQWQDVAERQEGLERQRAG